LQTTVNQRPACYREKSQACWLAVLCFKEMKMTATLQIYTLLIATWICFIILIIWIASLVKRIDALEKAAEQCVHTDPPSALVSAADSTNTAGG